MTKLVAPFSLNAFTQTPVRGLVARETNNNVLTYRLNNADASQVTSAGDLCIVTAGGDGMPVCQEVPVDFDASTSFEAGFVVYISKVNQYGGELATLGYNILSLAHNEVEMYMIAGSAIPSGSRVAYNGVAGDDQGKIIVAPASATAGVVPCGYALTEAKNAGDLFIVKIDFNK